MGTSSNNDNFLPLRWESTGEQWWYACPIDWAAANGHYDLVRQLIKIDPNNFINLTSLRRIRRLETVWDDDDRFHDVATCRSLIARELFFECHAKTGNCRNSLIGSGYGGWLLYTAASAGDLGFVRELLEIDPLLVFGEGEYGVTDMLYAGARSKNSDVFKIIYDFAASPRFSASEEEREREREIQIPRAYTWEMMNRGVHAAARAGNLGVLKEIILGCKCDILGFRDVQGSSILHAAASRGQVTIVEYLILSFDIIHSTDKNGNIALHIAAHRGHLSVVEYLITSSPPSIHKKNNFGETFLHMVISGFQNPTFHRLDRQIQLMKLLVQNKLPEIENIINVINNDGRTALHLAIIGNVHSELIELLMTVGSIDVNIRDTDKMTPLDLLKQWPRSVSSDTLTKNLISAGGIFSCQDYIARKNIASHLRMRSIGSPGTSFTISDNEIYLHTSNENIPDKNNNGEHYLHDSTIEIQKSSNIENKKPRSISYAKEKIKRLFHWSKGKEKKREKVVKTEERDENEIPVSLREKYSKPTSLPNNKRTMSTRSNFPSPISNKKQFVNQRRSRSSSFSKASSISSSPISFDKQKGVFIESDMAGPSSDYETPNLGRKNKSINRSLMNQYLCFGGTSFVKDPIKRGNLDKDYKDYALSVA